MLEKNHLKASSQYCVILLNNSVKVDQKKILDWPEAHSWWFLQVFPGKQITKFILTFYLTCFKRYRLDAPVPTFPWF